MSPKATHMILIVFYSVIYTF